MSVRRIPLIILMAALACFAMMRWCSAQIVALGASATAGYGLPPSDSFPAQLQAMNDSNHGVSAAQHSANIASIRQQLAARHIRVIDATGLIASAARAGLLQGDRLHLTAEGNRRVAAGLLASVR